MENMTPNDTVAGWSILSRSLLFLALFIFKDAPQQNKDNKKTIKNRYLQAKRQKIKKN
jgi:hypothetical protein